VVAEIGRDGWEFVREEKRVVQGVEMVGIGAGRRGFRLLGENTDSEGRGIRNLLQAWMMGG